MKLPQEYENRMRDLLGAEAEDYFRALDGDVPRTLRINRIKVTGDVPLWGDMKLTPIPGSDGIMDAVGTVGGKNPLHHGGAYYIQEFSAMLPVMSAPIEQGWSVLDLCAAPGGKTGQLLSAVGEEGFVVTNEYSRSRAKVLLGNVERMGARNCAVYNSSPDKLCSAFSGRFDLVLVDAPCSGEGMFRREADAVADWSPENTEGCAVRQREILRSAALSVKPGGWLLYSTCTFSPEEDEETVVQFLREHPQFTIAETGDVCDGLAPGIPVEGYDTALCRRAYPHRVRGEGQFFCLLRRDTSPVPQPKKKKSDPRARGQKGAPAGWEIRDLTAAERRVCDKFIKEFFGEMRELSLRVFGGDVFVTDGDDLFTDGLMCPGVRLGTVEGNRLVPAHHFFSAFGGEALLRLDFPADSPYMEKYLHGEGFSAEECGLSTDTSAWGCVTVCGIPVGGFRLAAGYVKNHYPKGLRT